MTNPIVITRDTVSRPWAELEPKIAIALITGFLAVIALIVAKSVGVKLPDEVKEVIPFAFAILCGYLTKSSGTVITQFGDNGSKIVESHRGPTESILTGAIPTQPAAPTSTPIPPTPDIVKRSSFTEAVEGTSNPDDPTQVIPSSDRVAAFVRNLPSSSPLAVPPEDGH